MATDNSYTEEAMKNHVKTYSGFVTLLKWSCIMIAAVLIAMALFLL